LIIFFCHFYNNTSLYYLISIHIRLNAPGFREENEEDQDDGKLGLRKKKTIGGNNDDEDDDDDDDDDEDNDDDNQNSNNQDTSNTKTKSKNKISTSDASIIFSKIPGIHPTKVIYKYFKRLIKMWESDLDSREDSEKRSTKGKQDTKLQKQVKICFSRILEFQNIRTIFYPKFLTVYLIYLLNHFVFFFKI
jgi:hypothetical protein